MPHGVVTPIANDRQQPGFAFAPLKSSVVADGAQVGVLHDIFGVMVIVLAGAGSRGLSGILVDLFRRFSPPRLWLVFQKPGAVRP